MEITIDTILTVGGWLFGGGALGGLLTWRFTRRKAKAEALEAEAEAEQKKAEAEQERQNYYQQIIDDIAKDRDYYKTERNELRGRLDSITQEVSEIKRTGEEERSRLQLTIESLTQKVDSMEPKLCYRMECPNRLAATDIKCIKKTAKKKENPLEGIEPPTGPVI